jgi:hypothetical protein
MRRMPHGRIRIVYWWGYGDTVFRIGMGRRDRRASGRRRAWLLLAAALIGLTSLLMPAQPAAVGAPAKSTKLGFFWTPPTDGTSVSTIATTTQIVAFNEGKEDYRNQLRNAGFTGKAFQYILAGEVEGPGPYANSSAWCNSNHTPLHNQVADNRGDFCTYIHRNESWFLHNGAGKRLYNTENGRVLYYMNPASAGWREFARSRMKADATSLGWDGLFLDNVDLSRHRLTDLLNNADGTVREYATNDAYRTAWVGFLQVLSNAIRPGKLLWANMTADVFTGSAWNPYMQHLDGGMFEGFATGYGSSGVSVDRWNAMLTQAQATLGSGKGVLMVAQGDKWNNIRQVFGLASYLLVTNNSTAYFRYARAGQYQSLWQYSNYNVALGNPRGARYQVSGGRWKRDFECGSVEVDPAARTGKITTSACTGGSPTPGPSPNPPDGRIALPGTLQAEDYRDGGTNFAYVDTTAGNTGGAYRNDDVDIQDCTDAASGANCHNVGWIEAGEWLAYNVSTAQAGNYRFTIRVAAKNPGKRLHIEFGGQDISGSITVPHTGGYQTWTNVTTGPIWISAGEHTMRIVAETDGFNVNFVTVAPA